MEENKDLNRQQVCAEDLTGEFEFTAELLVDLIGILNTELDDCDFCPLIDEVITLLVNPVEENGVLAIFRDFVGCFIEEALNDTDPDCPPDYDLAAQLNRLLCLLDNLEVILNSIVCTDNEKCEKLIGTLICALVQIILELISLALKLAVLARYRCYCEPIGRKVFDCVFCDFVNELDCFEELLRDIKGLVIALIDCDMDNCTLCFVAKKTSREE